MTKDFFNRWMNRKVDYDGYFGAQCVDLYRVYCQFLEIPQSPPVRGAANIWDTYLQDKFDRIPNTLTAIPQEGDIVIWSSKLNGYGHVAICQSGNYWNLTCFGQNWPVGSACHFQKTGYRYVLGWLRLKPVPAKPFKFESPLQIAFLSPKIEPYDDFIARVGEYASGKVKLRISDYMASFTGGLSQDKAYAFVDKINPKEKFVFLFTPNVVFYSTYYYPKRDCMITQVPGYDGRSLAFELAHQMQTWYNEHRGSGPRVEVEDSMGPTDEMIKRKYQSISGFL